MVDGEDVEAVAGEGPPGGAIEAYTQVMPNRIQRLHDGLVSSH